MSNEQIDDYGVLDEERNMLSFFVTIVYPKGERLKTLFTGKIKGDRITGTFVDDEGLTGTWTATREKEN